MATDVSGQAKLATSQPCGCHSYLITVKQYHRMIQTGVFSADDRVELLEGRLVRKMTHNPPHDGTITRVQRRLARVLGDDWLIRIQSAITTKDSEPEPDLVVVSDPEETYFTRHPRPQDIALLIEVANATLEEDRRTKGRLYARARIRVYWIVNLVDRTIEVYTDPRGGKNPCYRRRQDYSIEQAVPLIIEGVEGVPIPVRELLP